MTLNHCGLSKRIIPDPYELGSNAVIDDGVVLGYPSGRTIPDRVLRIGSDAIIRSGTIIYGGSRIGSRLETGHGVVIREQNVVGDGLMIWSNSVIDYGCSIGNRVRIHSNVYLAQFTEIGDDVFLAPGVVTTNDPHPICTACMKGPVIESGAKIGANSTILPGVIIGKGSLIGAGAVVTKNVAPGSVIVGNPGRVMSTTSELNCRFGIKTKPYPPD